jgi:hypothetical protein
MLTGNVEKGAGASSLAITAIKYYIIHTYPTIYYPSALPLKTKTKTSMSTQVGGKQEPFQAAQDHPCCLVARKRAILGPSAG